MKMHLLDVTVHQPNVQLFGHRADAVEMTARVVGIREKHDSERVEPGGDIGQVPRFN